VLYHAYSANNFIFTGREAMLDEVKFGTNGWPTINDGKGPSVISASPFGGVQTPAKVFEDHFRSSLTPGWQWPQNNEPSIEFIKRSKGGIALGTKLAGKGDLLDAILARATTSGDYSATTVVSLSESKPGSMAGIAAIGDTANAAGLAAGSGKLVLWRRDKGQHQSISEAKAPESGLVHLKLVASKGSVFQFAFSKDGKQWTSIGDAQPGNSFPPWDRSIRAGLTVGGVENATGNFTEFRIINAK
jgi:beta-xylosidase